MKPIRAMSHSISSCTWKALKGAEYEHVQDTGFSKETLKREFTYLFPPTMISAPEESRRYV